eukprot:5903219-Pyramimonas_sp.AAC.3
MGGCLYGRGLPVDSAARPSLQGRRSRARAGGVAVEATVSHVCWVLRRGLCVCCVGVLCWTVVVWWYHE